MKNKELINKLSKYDGNAEVNILTDTKNGAYLGHISNVCLDAADDIYIDVQLDNLASTAKRDSKVLKSQVISLLEKLVDDEYFTYDERKAAYGLKEDLKERKEE
mgnify:FL=1